MEASGHYSWVVDEMERLGHCPKLANPLEAKRRMGLTRRQTSWMQEVWPFCSATAPFQKCGFRRVSYAINASCFAFASFWYVYGRE